MTEAGESTRKRPNGNGRGDFRRSGASKQPRGLGADLFAHTSTEDLAPYTPEDIAVFVRAAESILVKRAPGHCDIRIENPALAGRDRPAITLVEVLNDNMPFLVDSVLGELHDFGATIRLVAHPILTVERDRDGRLLAYRGTEPPRQGEPALRESLIQVHVDRLPLESERLALAERLEGVLTDVRRAVEDWRPMIERLREAIEAYRSASPPVDRKELDEAIAFLEWLGDNNFTFLGTREYDFVGGTSRGSLKRADKPGLGVLRDPAVHVLRRGHGLITTTPAIREFLMRPEPLIITKANTKSRVHRRAYMDYIGVKLYRPNGRLGGELRLVGLFTSTAYTRSVRSIPLLRRKVAAVLARAGFDPESHSGKALINVLETYPRDELFQIDEDKLYDFATIILALEERPRVRVLPRLDKFDRFVSIIAYVPRDRYDSAVRVRIGDYLAQTYDGHVSAFYPAFPEGTLTRVHFIIGRSGGPTPNPERGMLEAAVEEIVRDWSDRLDAALAALHDAARAGILAERYGKSFPAAYRDDFSPDAAIEDIGLFERLRPESRIAVAFHRPSWMKPEGIGLKLVHLGSPLALSERVPMLEDMGFRVIDERSYEILPSERPPIFLHDMVLESADRRPVDLERLNERLTACLMAVWHGKAESDGYNGLVLNAGLPWRDIALLRAASRYLRQAGSIYPQQYMAGTLNRHPAIAAAIVELFHARFAPGAADEAKAATILRSIEAALESVASLDEDRIIRRVVNFVGAMVRTNFFQPGADGSPHDVIALKLDSGLVEALPRPTPFREIFVYGTRVEGIHLRFGRVARGGIRWSDRPQDFRTEILGLAKAQQVKNAVIVPVGAKGGFIPKGLVVGATRDAVLAEGTDAYRIFIERLLDITDNLDGDRVVPPEAVVRHDGDDPYLVVAADKGTATFSDTANAIAVSRGFWLGDAFASGGSAGYDHKQMGITARGAWEAVKRHFREMDIDIQTTPFTVAGVGDMSGDVFGNGMLLSPATKLVAAFDHRDIFLDPEPDPETSLAERRRLFDLPRSSWQDYDRTKISAGGGVFSRAGKAIKLTREVRALLGLSEDRLTPAELVRAILKAEVDLLWFGGIGTFVRATGETDDKVGDRANDSTRVTAPELRARVVGEGANLAMTQSARIEYSLAGGRCNSDAIDNSAGVNTSDVEVNIKIALGRAVAEGKLDVRKRNKLLKAMTGEVADLVLRNNYLQPLAISLAERRGFEDFDFSWRLMKGLAARGVLDRRVEALPDDAEMAERQAAGKPLTRPEIAVLLAYAKLTLSDDLEASEMVDDPTLVPELLRYFPERMREAYRPEIEAHRLRRDIIATVLSNSMINRGGPTYLIRIADQAEATPAEVARAYLAVRDSFALREINGGIDRLDDRVDGTLQLDLYRVAQDLVLAKTAWFLRNASFAEGVGAVVAAYGPTIAQLESLIETVVPDRLREEALAKAESLADAGVPGSLGRRIAFLPALAQALDIHLVAGKCGAPLKTAAKVYFGAAEKLGIARLDELARGVSVTDHFDRLALERALETLVEARRSIVTEALSMNPKAADPLDLWIAERAPAVDRVLRAVTFAEGEALTISRATVAADLFADLARGKV